MQVIPDQFEIFLISSGEQCQRLVAISPPIVTCQQLRQRALRDLFRLGAIVRSGFCIGTHHLEF